MRALLASVLVLTLTNVADAQSYSRTDTYFGRGRITVLEPIPEKGVLPVSDVQIQPEPTPPVEPAPPVAKPPMPRPAAGKPSPI